MEHAGLFKSYFGLLTISKGKPWQKSPHLAIVGLHFTSSMKDYVNFSNEEYIKTANEWVWHQIQLTCGRLQRSPYQDASGFQNLFVDDLAGSGDISSSRGCREWAKGGSLRRGETRKLFQMMVLMVVSDIVDFHAVCQNGWNQQSVIHCSFFCESLVRSRLLMQGETTNQWLWCLKNLMVKVS